jgi:methylmalonyl-CoA mutase C-terminal domain/subunit
VAAALQESVDHIGITTLSSSGMDRFSKIIELLKKENASNIKITAGGFLNEEDIPRLKEIGVVEFFPKGTTYEELIQWSRENIRPTEFEDS